MLLIEEWKLLQSNSCVNFVIYQYIIQALDKGTCFTLAITILRNKLTKIIAISILENNIEADYTDLIVKPFFDKELFTKLAKYLDLVLEIRTR